MLMHVAHSKGIKITHTQARSQDLEKGGGYFERVRSVQTTLTRIFIALESVSHGLHENWDEISRKARKFKGFFRPKSGGLQKKKKKKVFTDFETELFSAETLKFKGFLAQNQVVSEKKKKRSSPILRLNFWPNSEIQTFEGGCFPMGGGGYFQFFTKNRPQNHQKDAILQTSQTNGGARVPPASPPGYATAHTYLKPGHTHMEADSIHGIIETHNKSTNTVIEIPRDWISTIQSIHRSKKLSVVNMERTDVKNASIFLQTAFW